MNTITPIRTMFNGLEGSWRLRRQLTSALPGFPSGIFEGTATFKPRQPSAHTVTNELLYAEQGELTTEDGLKLTANKKYIYRYVENEDKISSWFVKEDTKHTEGKEEVDYLFHDLEFDEKGNAWSAKGDHLCEMDMYTAMYDFRMPKVAEDSDELKLWGLRYKVKGPQKDYSSDTAFERTYSAEVAVR